MRTVILQVEGRSDTLDATREEVEEAIRAMAAPDGPTFIMLEDGSGTSMQSAGTNGAYVIEARDVYGEGFTHWRAASRNSPRGEPVTISYRQACPEGRHPPRCCPIVVDVTNRLGLDAVAATLLAFHASGERSRSTAWHDVTQEFHSRTSRDRDDGDIRDIRPGATRR